MKKAPKKKIVPKAQPVTHRVSDGSDVPEGQVMLSEGDVVLVHNADHIVDMVNDCRARCIPIAVRQVDYQTTGGKSVEFSTFGRTQSISRCIEPNLIRERRGLKGLKEFFTTKVSRREVEQPETTKGNGMSKANKNGNGNGKSKEIDGVKLPSNEYDACLWTEIHKGGTKEEIAARVAAQFPDVKGKEREWGWHLPKNALKWIDETVTDMKEAGLEPRVGKKLGNGNGNGNGKPKPPTVLTKAEADEIVNAKATPKAEITEKIARKLLAKVALPDAPATDSRKPKLRPLKTEKKTSRRPRIGAVFQPTS